MPISNPDVGVWEDLEEVYGDNLQEHMRQFIEPPYVHDEDRRMQPNTAPAHANA